MSRLSLFASFAALLATVTITDASSAKPTKPVDDGAAFDRQAASTTLSSVDLAKCKATNAKRGEGHITVKFETGGVATDATVDRGPMVGTPTAKCIAKAFKKQAKVPAFKGGPVHVGKTFQFD